MGRGFDFHGLCLHDEVAFEYAGASGDSVMKDCLRKGEEGIVSSLESIS
jgi:hypothetical protein